MATDPVKKSFLATGRLDILTTRLSFTGWMMVHLHDLEHVLTCDQQPWPSVAIAPLSLVVECSSSSLNFISVMNYGTKRRWEK